MVQMGLLLIRAGLQLLERYEPAFSQERDTCKTAIGEVTT
jgi:ribosomal protein S17E